MTCAAGRNDIEGLPFRNSRLQKACHPYAGLCGGLGSMLSEAVLNAFFHMHVVLFIICCIFAIEYNNIHYLLFF
jgi:hypothetical protein